MLVTGENLDNLVEMLVPSIITQNFYPVKESYLQKVMKGIVFIQVVLMGLYTKGRKWAFCPRIGKYGIIMPTGPTSWHRSGTGG